jgi:hypothetical protein
MESHQVPTSLALDDTPIIIFFFCLLTSAKISQNRSRDYDFEKQISVMHMGK